MSSRSQTEGIAELVVAWQASHGRNHLPWQQTRDPYRVWLSEIMLQQTQVATVLDYYERFLLNYPVARVEQQRVDIPDTHTATDTGVLSFVLHQEGKEPVVRARYTVMYAKAGDKWLIINHHLSQLVTSQ